MSGAGGEADEIAAKADIAASNVGSTQRACTGLARILKGRRGNRITADHAVARERLRRTRRAGYPIRDRRRGSSVVSPTPSHNLPFAAKFFPKKISAKNNSHPKNFPLKTFHQKILREKFHPKIIKEIAPLERRHSTCPLTQCKTVQSIDRTGDHTPSPAGYRCGHSAPCRPYNATPQPEKGIRKIARQLGTGVSTVQRVLG